MNDIEEKLWNYIDGSCSAEEQKAISLLIEQDEVYRLKYNELVQLNAEFSTMELDEPSMAFTYNVMEAIRTENATQPLKAAIDKRIIWGVGAFFAFAIVALLGLVLANMNWSAGAGSHVSIPVEIKMPHLENYFSAPVMKGFIFFDVVLSLFVLDSYLRKRASNKHA